MYGPGYAALYSSLLFFVVIIVAIVFGGVGGAVGKGIFGLITKVLSFLPYTILAWGFVMDLFTLQFRYSIASLTGIHTIIICLITEFVLSKFGHPNFTPMWTASSASVLTYYHFDYLVKNADKNPLMALITVLTFILTMLAQTLSGPASVGLFESALWNDAVAVALGVSCGLGAWVSTEAASPSLLPYAPAEVVAAAPAIAPTPAKADTSVAEARIKAIVNDLNQQHSNGYWRTNSGNVKVNEAEYAQLAAKLSAAGVSWTKPKYDPASPTNALS